MSQEFPKYAVVDVRMDESRGHDILGGYLLAALTELALQAQMLHLKPSKADVQGSESFLTRVMWSNVERGKAALAEQTASKNFLMKLTGMAIESVGKSMRNSNLVADVLKANYRDKLREMNGSVEVLISSHYMAFEKDAPYVQVYSGPDLYIHESVGKLTEIEGLKVLSPCRVFSEEMIGVGIKGENIVEAGVILPKRVSSKIPDRITNQALIDSGERMHKALVCVAAGMPERAEAIRAVELLMDEGIDTTVICGDNREKCIKFRKELEGIVVPDGVRLELIGGAAEFTRDDEVQAHIACMSDPELTVCFTRPNETMPIASSVGMRVITFRPFQAHEVNADRWIKTYAHNTLPFDDQVLTFPGYYPDLLEDESSSWIRAGELGYAIKSLTLE